jgi:uncharacterized protein (DUF2141 family)
MKSLNKKIPRYNIKFLFSFIFILFTSITFGQTIILEVSNLKSNKGQIIVAVFQDDQTFQEEVPKYDKRFSKKTVKDGKMFIKFNLPPGVYGFTLIDDENHNGDIDYNFIGLPKEGFGFSDYYHSGMIKPHFDKFKFNLKEGEERRVKTKIRYIY